MTPLLATPLLATLTHGPAAPERVARRANTLRAGVLGANDGIVSVAAIVVGVAGATAGNGPVLVAGLAALFGGAVSMALGEYVSVSSQRDSERAARGGPTAADAGPWAAALASAAAFLAGGVLPLAAVLLAHGAARVPLTVVSVLFALAVTGAVGARLGGASPLRPAVRTTAGGAVALALTWSLGALLSTAGAV